MLGNANARSPGLTPAIPRFSNTASDLRAILLGTRLRKVAAVWMSIWIFLEIFNLFWGSAHDRVVAYSMFICAGTTVAVWTYRDVLTERVRVWKASPRTKFIIIGSLGAAFAEYVFWQVERIFGETGIAANPNFALDLLVTMPWYIMMVFLLWKVQTRYCYSFTELFFLGGVYELGADGLVGSIMGGTFSAITIPSLIALIPFFALVYAIMVIPCSVLMRDDIDRIRTGAPLRTGNRYLYSMLPLMGLAPYFAIAFMMARG